MDQRLAFAIFFSIFLAVLVGMHYYVFARAVKLFDVKNIKPLIIVMIILIISFPLANFVERASTGLLARWFYTVSSAWFGMLFYLLMLFLARDLVALLMRVMGVQLDPFRSAATVIILTVIIVAYGIINAQHLVVKEVDIPIDNLPSELEGYKIVQLSDIHAGAINGESFVRRNVKLANSLKPNMVVITGDFFDGSGMHNMTKLAEPMKDLNAEHMFFVTGNHEMYTGADKAKEAIRSQGITILENEVREVGALQIVGIENPKQEMRKDNPDVLALDIDKNKPAILLYHVPLGLNDAAKAGIDLQLSGHTHGGQIFPFGLMEKPFYPVLVGLGVIDGMKIYVSAGSGTWGPPLRVGVPAEITLITLKAA